MSNIEQLELEVAAWRQASDLKAIEIERLRAERDDWKDTADTTAKFCDVKLNEAAAFLNQLADNFEDWYPQRPDKADECRQMAERLCK